MSRWKRAGLSWSCALAAEFVVSAALSRFQYGSDWKLEGVLFFAALELLFVLPGWLIVLPMVICFDELVGWKLWLLAVTGTAIGPLIMSIAISGMGRSGSDREAVIASLCVSLLTTASYIFFVKLGSRASIQPTT